MKYIMVLIIALAGTATLAKHDYDAIDGAPDEKTAKMDYDAIDGAPEEK